MRTALQTAWLLIWMWTAPGLAGDAVVRAVLFFSPTCPHCHTVMTEDLPPLAALYGEQLQILGHDRVTVGTGGREEQHGPDYRVAGQGGRCGLRPGPQQH